MPIAISDRRIEVLLRGGAYDGEVILVSPDQEEVILPLLDGHIVYVKTNRKEFGVVVFKLKN